MTAPRKVGMPLLVAYGLLGLPLAAATLPLYVHLPSYYADDLGLGLAAVGFAMFAMRIWDVVTDPLIGVLADRVGCPFGRRRLWVALGLPVAMLGGWLMFQPPEGATILYLVVAGLILHLGWTMVTLPYQAWGAELSGDYHNRSRIAASREAFVIAGTLVAGGLVAAAGSPETRAGAIGSVGWILVIGLPLAAIPLLWKVPDPRHPAPKHTSNWRAGFTLIATNKPFRNLLGAWILNGIANGLPATLFIWFVQDILTEADRSGLYLLTYFLVAVAGMPLWLLISRRLGKHKTWCVAMVWACGWFALAPLIGAGDSALYLALCIGTGLALGADLVLPASMQADVVDVDTAQRAEAGTPARTGLYFALWGMATKLSLALAVGIALPLLDASSFEAGSGSTEGHGVLVALYAVVPIAFKIAAIAVMWRFPLSGADQEALQDRIRAAENKIG